MAKQEKNMGEWWTCLILHKQVTKFNSTQKNLTHKIHIAGQIPYKVTV